MATEMDNHTTHMVLGLLNHLRIVLCIDQVHNLGLLSKVCIDDLCDR